MKDICPFEIIVSYHKSARYSNESLNALGPKIWNQSPSYIKAETCFTNFKEYIKNGSGVVENIMLVK